MVYLKFLPTSFVDVSVKFLFAFQLHRSLTSVAAMKVVRQNKFGSADMLYIESITDIPHPETNQVLIKTAATALNRADLLMRQGTYPGIKQPQTLGLEVSGVVHSMGSNATKWKKGDQVMALLSGGGYAEYVAVNEDHVMAVPTSLELYEGAAIPEVWLTAFQLLHLVGKVSKGETVLIHGGGSGVGTAAVQLVKQTQATAFVTAGSEEKINIAKSLGASAGFNYKEGEFADKVLNITNGKGVNLILDCVGGSFWKQNVKSLAVEGRWVVYGLLGGGSVDGALMADVLRKRLSIIGTTLKPRSNEYKAELIKQFSAEALPCFNPHMGAIHFKPVIDRVMKLDDVVEAHRYMASNQNKGKIILKIGNTSEKDEL